MVNTLIIYKPHSKVYVTSNSIQRGNGYSRD